MRVSIVGTGYVGLVSGACLAHTGHDVVCVDIDESKVARINRGEAPIYEKGLDDLLAGTIGTRLRATTDLAAAVAGTDATLIAVGTPFDGQRISLEFIEAAAKEIGEALRDKDGYHVVIVKSTVVPGTTDSVVLPILEKESGKSAGRDFGVGMNPEFLREGEAVGDFMDPDRIVLGGIDDRTLEVMGELYECFADRTDIVKTSPRTAEMIKYTANSLLASLISFSNEIANLSAAVGVDATEVMHGVHLDKRFAPLLEKDSEKGERVWPGSIIYLEGGCGFGGSCFPKDVKALIAFGKDHGQPMGILESVIALNEEQPKRMLTLLRKHLSELRDVPVTVLGMAFKPGTDDIRESPALTVTQDLLDAGAIVTVFDPIAEHEVRKHFGDKITYADSLGGALDGAEGVLLMTRWAEFEEVPAMLRAAGADPVLVDGRRMLPVDSVSRYEGIGR